LAVKDLPLNRSTHGPQTGLWEVKDRVLSGLSANRKLSSDPFCLAVLSAKLQISARQSTWR
jgi:hypothetical protein